MISPAGRRFMHLFKPDWSPETLLSGNYLFHLTAYRRALVMALGGLRREYEGSQDYDLLLRVAEGQPKVCHISRVLYHWRQAPASIALQEGNKTYTFDRGLDALKQSLVRRGLPGSAQELTTLGRGTYRVLLDPLPLEDVRVIPVACAGSKPGFASALAARINEASAAPYLVVVADSLAHLGPAPLLELVSWFRIPEVGAVTGRLLDPSERIIHAGLVLRPDGTLLPIYQGFRQDAATYMSATAIARNVSMPHPCFFAMRVAVWRDLGGFRPGFDGQYAVFDLMQRMLASGSRVVYTPFAAATVAEPEADMLGYSEPERKAFADAWRARLEQGDPYYNRWLTLDRGDMGLAL
jgi:hypothetical protein